MSCRAGLGILGVLALLAGCGPAVETVPGSGTSTDPRPTSSGVVDDSASGTSGTTTSGAGTTSSSTSTPPAESSTTGAALETSTGQPEYCEDFPRRDYLQLVNEDLPRGAFVSRIDALCLVQGSTADGELLTYQLQCDEGLDEPVPHVLDVYSHDGEAQPLVEGETIRLRAYLHTTDYGLFGATLLTTPEGELLAGEYPWPFAAPEDVLAWFDVTAEMVDIGCATVEPDPPSGFITEPCPWSSTVMGANVTWGEIAVALEPGTRIEVGELRFSGSFGDYEYVDDSTCYQDGFLGAVAFHRQRS